MHLRIFGCRRHFLSPRCVVERAQFDGQLFFFQRNIRQYFQQGVDAALHGQKAVYHYHFAVFQQAAARLKSAFFIAHGVGRCFKNLFQLLQNSRCIFETHSVMQDFKMIKSGVGRTVVLLFLFLVSYQRVSAQSSEGIFEEIPRTFYGGLLLGTNFAQVDGDAYAGYHKVGLNVGGIVYTRLSEHAAVSLEILFSQKGARGNQLKELSSGSVLSKYAINLNYAEIPVMFNYFDRRRSHFGAGFSYSQLVSANEVIEVSNNTSTTSLDASAYPFRKNDFNVVAGGNLHLWKGLFLNARFQYSLLTIRKNFYPGFGRAEQYNNLWAVRLMYLF